VLRYFYAGRLFISEVKPRAFKPTFQVKKLPLEAAPPNKMILGEKATVTVPVLTE
jgi:hypothetical protein